MGVILHDAAPPAQRGVPGQGPSVARTGAPGDLTVGRAAHPAPYGTLNGPRRRASAP
ncbi:hypothetical protein ABZ135_25480 [Streptomyces sp. NPDC006339]|uniref:hypothetical protein n=1 Tax=Streptomyces sp. NPDC006339 TaxID=3156755 RepID=UPI0033AB7B14